MSAEPDLFERAAAKPEPVAHDPLTYAILAELRRKEQASEDVAASLGLSVDVVRRIVRKLYEADVIEDAGLRAATPTYKAAIVWRVAP